MKRVPKRRGVVPGRGASALPEIEDDKDRAGSCTYIKVLRLAAYACPLNTSGWRPIHFSEREQGMPGRGPQTFKKRQKEQQRKERQQEKMAKRLARKDESARAATGDQETAAAFTAQDAKTETPETNGGVR